MDARGSGSKEDPDSKFDDDPQSNVHSTGISSIRAQRHNLQSVLPVSRMCAAVDTLAHIRPHEPFPTSTRITAQSPFPFTPLPPCSAPYLASTSGFCNVCENKRVPECSSGQHYSRASPLLHSSSSTPCIPDLCLL